MTVIVEKARNFAKKAHEGQIRKLTNDPYLYHVDGVAKILTRANLDDETIAAGYLHDVVEDTDTTLEEIRSAFGDAVASIVAGNTENKQLGWEERKQHTIESISTASFQVKALIGADKLDNLTSLIETYKQNGNQIWKHFKRGREQQLWYYSSVASQLLEHTGSSSPKYFYELKEKLDFFTTN